jgi:hypothetical protein
MDRYLEDIDGVTYLVADGKRYRYSDVQRLNNPNMDFDPNTGDPIYAPPSGGTIEPRTPAVSEDVAAWFADKIQRVGGDFGLSMDDRAAYRAGEKIAGILDFVPPSAALMSGVQADRDIDAGNYGSAALNAGFAALDAATMGAGGAGLKALRATDIGRYLDEGMFDVADTPAGREYFAEKLRAAQASQGPIGRSVDVYAPDEYAGTRMAMTPAGDAGYVVKPDGEIASVVKAKDSPIKGFGGSVLRRSEGQGGNWLNAFDTALTDIYGRGGFQPVSRLPFSEEMAAEGWGQEALDDFMRANAPYNGGRPDLVFMARNPAAGVPDRSVRGGLLTDDYDLAVQELDRELKRLGYRQ